MGLVSVGSSNRSGGEECYRAAQAVGEEATKIKPMHGNILKYLTYHGEITFNYMYRERQYRIV